MKNDFAKTYATNINVSTKRRSPNWKRNANEKTNKQRWLN